MFKRIKKEKTPEPQNWIERNGAVLKFKVMAGVQEVVYEGWSKSFRPDQLFKAKEIKQLCYFSI